MQDQPASVSRLKPRASVARIPVDVSIGVQPARAAIDSEKRAGVNRPATGMVRGVIPQRVQISAHRPAGAHQFLAVADLLPAHRLPPLISARRALARLVCAGLVCAVIRWDSECGAGFDAAQTVHIVAVVQGAVDAVQTVQ